MCGIWDSRSTVLAVETKPVWAGLPHTNQARQGLASTVLLMACPSAGPPKSNSADSSSMIEQKLEQDRLKEASSCNRSCLSLAVCKLEQTQPETAVIEIPRIEFCRDGTRICSRKSHLNIHVTNQHQTDPLANHRPVFQNKKKQNPSPPNDLYKWSLVYDCFGYISPG